MWSMEFYMDTSNTYAFNNSDQQVHYIGHTFLNFTNSGQV